MSKHFWIPEIGDRVTIIATDYYGNFGVVVDENEEMESLLIAHSYGTFENETALIDPFLYSEIVESWIKKEVLDRQFKCLQK